MTDHAMALTSHTTELRQVAEMNVVLARGDRVTADSLGVRNEVPADAVLHRLRAVGPPSYPYIYGIFVRGADGADGARPVLVELHTAQLRALCDRLHLRGQIWGT
ncbi:hypothetical protein [Phycicoccus sp. SLBN-51]|jgi:hypothetical protein|uniref:hypothetical protein n=1 Tax=Phycicoccus sp. SLBN-51 TaxID=2768447 RepID=UPI001153FB8A|nr:hypothetical protein [Phycicoccus sp. SLBN-51]TQJ52276.1 hypothetical protein FBY26_4029 [Phycicoccus sp. SLBN-51]